MEPVGYAKGFRRRGWLVADSRFRGLYQSVTNDRYGYRRIQPRFGCWVRLPCFDGIPMTALYITIDTEYSANLAARIGLDRRENFSRTISCETAEGSVGVVYQMDVLDRLGLKAIFFVDPMPALVWGVEAITDVVAPIIARGHDIQLHVHPDWLQIAGSRNPLRVGEGFNIRDFGFEDQCAILDYARSTLIAAGAPAPVAFRAGNYAANDNTLRALAELGMKFDTSHCPGFPGSDCAISLGPQDRHVTRHCGVIEAPIGCIGAPGGSFRHLQLTALTTVELLAAMRHAAAHRHPCITMVSHSFELLSRDRTRINHIVRRRFERFCEGLSTLPQVSTSTYARHPPAPSPTTIRQDVLPHRPLKTAVRVLEQGLSNALYESAPGIWLSRVLARMRNLRSRYAGNLASTAGVWQVLAEDALLFSAA